ncbi:hypothetical protein GCM10010172_09860 [Paractinoplanes ferrugineus]|uniref:Uncharacterized protein n=1 Tax=Paractinoplanes ferrugineus TaxID=113564 RepID=A0A919IV69_9ACTN|nr:hypothetical protein [Actinoplanes ferrugineus]GIE09550.1 hypothetical protein Afe05nite_13900 [Actinoplanes ferrugineus]
MNRGPAALSGAIVAVGLGPAMWMGVRLGSVEVAPSKPPAVVGEHTAVPDRLVGGTGADRLLGDEPEVAATPRGRVLPLTGKPSPSSSTAPSASPSATTPSAPSTEPSSEPTSTPPTEATTATTPPTGPSTGATPGTESPGGGPSSAAPGSGLTRSGDTGGIAAGSVVQDGVK